MLRRFILYPFFYLSLLTLIIISTGCYPRYRIQEPKFNPTPSVHTTEDGVRVTVIPSYWTGSPANLQNYVTPFYIDIENYSGKSLTLSYEDIVLFDEFRTQYGPINPETVAQIIRSSEYRYFYPSYPRVSIGIGGGYYGGYHRWGRRGYYRPYYWPYGFYAFSPIWYYPPAPYYYTKPVNTVDIVAEALIPGIIHPNSSVEGYVYFRQIPDQVTSVTLDVGYGIKGTSEHTTLSFPFSAPAGGF